jgi:glycosyltransferase involved in cell wall biosynthesis
VRILYLHQHYSGPGGSTATRSHVFAEALAARGHEVSVRTNCTTESEEGGVDWRPLRAPWPKAPDLYIANRSHRLIRRAPQARARLFWIHTPADYLRKPRYLWKLWRARPVIVFSGPYHAATCPSWVPAGGRVIIPYGVPEAFCATGPVPIPPPRAVFASNPLRGLDRLLDLWTARIRPVVPQAELHVFSGPETYGALPAAKARAMKAVLDRAAALEAEGVRLRGALPKSALLRAYAEARVMLYPGDAGETFCLAVAEGQAAGLPAVVRDVGCLGERVRDGLTGFVAQSEADFVARAIALLADAGLWRRQHRAALASQRDWRWTDAAAAFEALIPLG